MFPAVVFVLLSASQVAAQAAPGPDPAAETANRAESVAAPETRPPGHSTPPGATAVGHPLADLVTIEAGATCLNRERLIERVARWLQRTTIAAPLRVYVRGDREIATRVFFSVVREPGESAERRLDNAPSDCNQLHSAVALSIALAIEATLQHPLPTAGEIPDEPAKTPGWKRKSSARPVHLELALLGGASVGVLTGASLAGAPRLGLSPWPWFELALVGLATHLSGQTIEQVSGSFSSTLIAGGLDACFGGETTQAVGFFMCVGARAGAFQSAGDDFESDNFQTSESWGAVAASGQGRFWLSRAFGIATGVEALYALKPRDLVVVGREGAPTQYRAVPNLGLSVTVGPVLRFF